MTKKNWANCFNCCCSTTDGKIDGFDEDLWVIQDREDCADMAEVYRKNICHLLERLEAFRDNGYSNEGLMEYYIRKEQKDIDYSADFTSVRILSWHGKPACEGKRRNHDEAGRNGRNLCPGGSQKQKVAIPPGISHLAFGERSRCCHEILPLFFRINDTITKRQEV